jgi:hypothetical protein
MEYTAEQYLERIENKRLNSTPLYSRKEMIDFAEKYAKQLTLTDVSESVATEYAEFCVRCDREKLPLLKLEDYIKQYCH